MAGRLRSAYDMQNEKVDLGLVSRMIITTTIVISFWQFIFSCFSLVFFFHLLQISFSFFLFGLKKLFYYYYYYSLFFFLKYKKKIWVLYPGRRSDEPPKPFPPCIIYS